MRWMWMRTSTTVMMLLATACGESNSGSETLDGVADASSARRALVFTVNDPGYTSSRVYVNDLASGTLTEALSGESGDPYLFATTDGMVLFNRREGRQDFKTLTFDGAGKLAVGTEHAAEALGKNDPTDALQLDAHRLLVAGGNSQTLAVIDPTDGHLVQQVTAEWDLRGGTAFRPAKFWKHGDRVYVFTQGRDGTDLQVYDGSQQVFVLRDDPQAGLVAVDLDASDAKIQGRKLSVNPYAVTASGEAAVRVGGLCYPTDKDCRGGFETVSLDDQVTVTQGPALPSSTLSLGGTVVTDKDGALLANAMTAEGTSVVARIEPTAAAVSVVHTFPAGSFGCCGLFYDDTSGTVYVGDRTPGEATGFLSVYHADATEPQKIALPGIPYVGAFYAQ